MASSLNIDKLDLKIINEMMNDAGISYADLGKKIVCFRRYDSCSHEKLQELGIVKGTRLQVDLKNRIRCNRLRGHLSGKEFALRQRGERVEKNPRNCTGKLHDR